MGLLVDGQWVDQWYDTEKSGGRFERSQGQFRNWVTPDGAPGPSGRGGFKAEPGRYHLYVSYACPWAHRTLIYRKLKGLEDMIGLSVVHWLMADEGWIFDSDPEGIVGDRLLGKSRMHEVYTQADPRYSGRVTVPVLWDMREKTIVSNESSEIIRMFNSAFDGVSATAGDYYPEALRREIDAWNERLYSAINNGVYRCGFATSQEAYDEAVGPLFEELDYLETYLAGQRFLCGNEPTEADWRLFPTLYRFDAVYVGHFKCGLRRLIDYPNLWAYARDLCQWPGIRDTVNMEHARRHYYESHTTINPTRVVSIMPDVDWGVPHGRNSL